MAILGRNDKCPCGSAKKYKKCCIDKEILKFEKPKTHINLDDVKKLDTDTIISRLKYFGVNINKEEFIIQTDNYYSAVELSEHWFKKHNITAVGREEDFLWIAAWVLWNRLIDDKKCDEEIEQKMFNGYECLENNKVKEAFGNWLELWEYLKTRIKDCGYNSLEELEDSFYASIYLSNWVDDMEMQLHNAGLDHEWYFKKLIQFAKEFIKLLPESNQKTIQHLRRAEAETYFYLGESEKGEQKFKQIIKDYPNWAWGYIGWGDQYGDFAAKDLMDKEKARKIYQLALKEENDIDEEDIVYVKERIDNL